MAIAAVPEYLGSAFKTASPGLRFGIYLPIWTERKDQETEVKKRAEAKSKEGNEIADLLKQQGMDAVILKLQQRERNPLAKLWEKNDFAAKEVWQQVTTLTQADKNRMQALAVRQVALSQTCGDETMLILDAQSIAPFSTGLGNEHPLENGFAFLNPYGLPYLPGSGVKGVLRQAAEELANGEWGDAQGWNTEKCYPLEIERGKPPIRLSMIDTLFGRETMDGDKEHVRGVLSFWDVIPKIHGDHLAVDIMTPHQSHYYQKKCDPKAGNSDTPHESGQPNPICFLTVPPQSGFVFHVQCDRTRLKRLAPELLENDRWKELLKAAFTHAFDWIGFGAKTAVGYGAMSIDEKARQNREKQTRENREAEVMRIREEEEKARLAAEPEWKQIRAQVLKEKAADVRDELALLKALEDNRWPLPDEARQIAEEIARILRENKEWREKSDKKNPEKDRLYQRTLKVKKYL
jgi:CRISPR-associated protein Cmr6